MDTDTYRYDYETGLFTFPDGVQYTLREALHISKTALTMEDVEAIHKVKNIFDGQVLDGTEEVVANPEKTRFDKMLDQAREMARQNIRYLSNVRRGKVKTNGTRIRHDEAQTRLLLD